MYNQYQSAMRTRSSKEKEKGQKRSDESEKKEQKRSKQKNVGRTGRPPKSEGRVVENSNKRGEELANSFLMIFQLEYLKRLNLGTLYPLQPFDSQWNDQEDFEKIKNQLQEMGKKQKRLNMDRIDEFSFVIAHFGGRNTFPYRHQFYQVMLRLVAHGWQQVLNSMISPEGKSAFPYFNLNIKDVEIKKRPTDEKINGSLKLLLQRLEDEIKKYYFI